MFRRAFSSSTRAAENLRMIMLGAPGSGKGTLSGRLIKEYKIETLGVGDILRQEVNSKSALGTEIAAVMKAGGLLSDDIIIKIVEPYIASLKGNWLLDGFPRKGSQAAALDSMLAKLGSDLNLVVNLDVPDQVILSRIEERWIHPASGRMYNNTFNPPKTPGKDDVTGEPLVKRVDDSLETAKKRLVSFHKENVPILEYYKDKKVPNSTEPLLVHFAGETSNEIYPKLKAEVLRRFPDLK